MSKPAPRSFGNRILVDVALGMGIVVAAVLFALLSIYTGKTIPIGWLGLGGFTPLLLWLVIRSQRRHWKRLEFWLAMTGLAVLHVLAFVAILMHYPQWPLLWFVPVTLLEAGVFIVILGKVFDDGDRA